MTSHPKRLRTPNNLPWQALLRRMAVDVPRQPAPHESWMFRTPVGVYPRSFD